MKPQRLVPFVFAGFLGLLAVLVMRQHITQQQRVLEGERQRYAKTFQNLLPVVVASRDLPEGTVLQAAHLAPREIPQDFAQPYAVQDPQPLLGQVTLAPIAKDEQVLMNKVRRPEATPSGATLAHITPSGKRAVTIGIDVISGVGGFIVPGDQVDVLWTVEVPSDGGGQLATLTIFQGVQVLAMGSHLAGRYATGSSGQGDGQTTVTLALEPEKAGLLLFARELGKIQLSLRPRTDEQPAAVPPATLVRLLESVSGRPVMASPQSSQPSAPPPSRQVEVYRGLEREVVSPQGSQR